MNHHTHAQGKIISAFEMSKSKCVSKMFPLFKVLKFMARSFLEKELSVCRVTQTSSLT